MQIWLILFQTAKQPLGPGDLFFQRDHSDTIWRADEPARPRSTVPQPRPDASYKLDSRRGQRKKGYSERRGSEKLLAYDNVA